MTTGLPNPGIQSPEDHMAISYRFLEEADRAIAAGLRLRASEKIWGAATHALSSIAEQRGWLHHAHTDFYDIVGYLGKEYGRPELVNKLQDAEVFHVNFYHNQRRTDHIIQGLAGVKLFVDELDELRQRPMQPFKIENGSEQARVHNLTGNRYPLGTESATGFSNGDRLARLSPRWGNNPPDIAGNPDDAASATTG